MSADLLQIVLALVFLGTFCLIAAITVESHRDRMAEERFAPSPARRPRRPARRMEVGK